MAAAFEEVIGVREAFSGLEQPPADEVTIAGADPVFSTRFKIAETCAAVLGASTTRRTPSVPPSTAATRPCSRTIPVNMGRIVTVSAQVVTDTSRIRR